MVKSKNVARMESAIHLIRGQRVVLDSDLALIYGVTTKRFNEQVRRNLDRFPSDFAFHLATKELTNLRSQIATSSYGGRRYLPWVFTEHGAIMLASILNSQVAIDASVRVVRAFVHLRQIVGANAELSRKFGDLERRLDSHDADLAELFAAIRHLLKPPAQKQPGREIGFHVREKASRYRASKSKIL